MPTACPVYHGQRHPEDHSGQGVLLPLHQQTSTLHHLIQENREPGEHGICIMHIFEGAGMSVLNPHPTVRCAWNGLIYSTVDQVGRKFGGAGGHVTLQQQFTN